MTYFVVEASHLFRAGELFSAQIYVIDVINYLNRSFFEASTPPQSWVLFGSTKDSQAEKYQAAVERHGIKVIRMKPVDSRINPGAKFYKPSLYLHSIFENLPKGSQVVLVGFHNTRFEDILKKYKNDFEMSVCAFTTRTRVGANMEIPDSFRALTKHCIKLDNHIDGIKAEFQREESNG